ncbi:MAG: helix-turn-helix transcriptional regulator [Alphaproteobacteria bacterium]|nr:helix-turn-helix transcriptional regulator [Alphaproteobacteria bacterium]MBN2780128.1 helix-turn-helix transcriptional regulator [Alphaproteobacteria bacterium]
MDINQRILPTPDMIRSARGYLNWSQHELGQRCNLSKVSLVGIESGRQKPNHETLKRIASVFWNEGLIFLPEGGFRVENNLVKILEGNDPYSDLLEDIEKTLKEEKGEVLFQGADESRSSESVVQKKRKLYREGIEFKHLIEEKNTYIMGDLEDYRWVKPDVFMNDDVTVIYNDKLAFVFYREGEKKVMIIKDKVVAESHRKFFYKIWKNSEKPTQSTSPVKY